MECHRVFFYQIFFLDFYLCSEVLIFSITSLYFCYLFSLIASNVDYSISNSNSYRFFFNNFLQLATHFLRNWFSLSCRSYLLYSCYLYSLSYLILKFPQKMTFLLLANYEIVNYYFILLSFLFFQLFFSFLF